MRVSLRLSSTSLLLAGVLAAGAAMFNCAPNEPSDDANGAAVASNDTAVTGIANEIGLRLEYDERSSTVLATIHRPLAQGEVLGDETLMTVAAHHEKSVAQVILRWHLQLGNVVIPKSATPERIRANLDLFDFELSEDDLADIARLEAGHRTGPDPETFGAS